MATTDATKRFLEEYKALCQKHSRVFGYDGIGLATEVWIIPPNDWVGFNWDGLDRYVEEFEPEERQYK